MSMPRKIRCVVETITPHGGGVYTLDLTPDGLVPPFRPGQFLHLTVDEYDPAGFWPESRVFSIASSPRDRKHLRLCYSVKGSYTSKMERTLKEGGEVWVKMPYGDFVIDATTDVVLVAGGTGISAFTAFLEALTPECERKVTLVYGARTPDLFLFLDMILEQAARVQNFDVVFFAETSDDVFTQKIATHPRRPACRTGRIDLSPACSLISAPRPLTSVVSPPTSDLRPPTSTPCPPPLVFHLSGPPVMLKALTERLKTQGVNPEQIRTDAWE